MGRDLLRLHPHSGGRGHPQAPVWGRATSCAPIPLAETWTWAHTCLRLCTFSKNRLRVVGLSGGQSCLVTGCGMSPGRMDICEHYE